MMSDPNKFPRDPFEVDYMAADRKAAQEEMHAKYMEWYKSLKPGDEVYYRMSYGLGYRDSAYYTQVAKITTTGMVRTEDGKLFDSEGVLRGGTGSKKRLQPITDAVVDYEVRKKLLSEVSRIQWGSVDTEGLRKLLVIEKEHKLQEYSL